MRQSKLKAQLDSKPRNRGYAKYSALAFQIVATILIVVYAGGKLDAYLNNDTPWFTLLGAVLAVVGSMVYLIVRVTKSK